MRIQTGSVSKLRPKFAQEYEKRFNEIDEPLGRHLRDSFSGLGGLTGAIVCSTATACAFGLIGDGATSLATASATTSWLALGALSGSLAVGFYAGSAGGRLLGRGAHLISQPFSALAAAWKATSHRSPIKRAARLGATVALGAAAGAAGGLFASAVGLPTAAGAVFTGLSAVAARSENNTLKKYGHLGLALTSLVGGVSAGIALGGALAIAASGSASAVPVGRVAGGLLGAGVVARDWTPDRLGQLAER